MSPLISLKSNTGQVSSKMLTDRQRMLKVLLLLFEQSSSPPKNKSRKLFLGAKRKTWQAGHPSFLVLQPNFLHPVPKMGGRDFMCGRGREVEGCLLLAKRLRKAQRQKILKFPKKKMDGVVFPSMKKWRGRKVGVWDCPSSWPSLLQPPLQPRSPGQVLLSQSSHRDVGG